MRLVAALLIVVFNVVQHWQGAVSAAPQLVLTSSEGDTTYIPCLISNPSNRTALIWGINEVLYPITDLPNGVSTSFYGLVIKSVSVNASYICYEVIESSELGVYNLQLVSKILLSVNMKDNFQPSEVSTVRIVSQKVMFNENVDTFGWKFENPVCADNETITTIKILMCSANGSRSVIMEQNTTRKVIDIPEFEFVSSYYLYIPQAVAKNNTSMTCGKLETLVTVADTARTQDMFVNEGQAVCLDLCAQTPNYVNWPTRPRSTDDCTCPVNNNSIKSCSCVNNTDYEVSINVSKVCWNHLDRQKNNTKVFLFTEELISNCSSLEMPVRIYCKSAKFLITAAPDPSPPTFVQNTSDVCFESNSSVPVRYYQVLITDNTGDTSNTTYFGVRSCTSLSELQYVCAPFTITVTAHTEFSSSRPGVYVVNDTQGKEPEKCSCINMKVNASLNADVPSDTSVTVWLNLSCNKVPPNVNTTISAFPILSNSSACNRTIDEFLSVALTCHDQQQHHKEISRLCPSTEYLAYAAWVSSQFMCPISGVVSFNTTGQYNEQLAVWIAVPLSFVVCIIVILSVSVCLPLVIYWRKKNRKNMNIEK